MKSHYNSCLTACVADIQTVADIVALAPAAAGPNLVGSLCVMLVGHWEDYARACLTNFSTNKHPVFASYLSRSLDRMNARIKIGQMKEDYLSRFGSAYKAHLDRLIAACDKQALTKYGIPASQGFLNIIEWRHSFVHNRKQFPAVRVNEVIQSFVSGSAVLRCYMIVLK